VPVKNLAELIAWIKKKNAAGEKVSSATGALGGPEHLSTEQLAIATKLDVLIVPYRSAGLPWSTSSPGRSPSASSRSRPAAPR
jgi:tripartite-type tricarboxylate transporter receptor subunit TctC